MSNKVWRLERWRSGISICMTESTVRCLGVVKSSEERVYSVVLRLANISCILPVDTR